MLLIEIFGALVGIFVLAVVVFMMFQIIVNSISKDLIKNIPNLLVGIFATLVLLGMICVMVIILS